MRKNDDEYMRGFKDELTAFIGRVKGRAEARIEKAMREYEEVQLRYSTLSMCPYTSFVKNLSPSSLNNFR